MNRTNKKIISTNDLFPIIGETLNNGYKVKFTVSGNSMLPWIVNNRDQVLLAKTARNQLKIGDILLFRDKRGKYILHRIYKKEADGYRTIGDGCLYEDGLVKPGEIMGVVEKIYRKGREIDCNSLLWRLVFYLWRKLLPIRGHLLKIYFLLTHIKSYCKNLRIKMELR